MADDSISGLRLRTPEAIQDFLDSLSYNFEKSGETCSPALAALGRGSAHCLEAAFIACASLRHLGERPLVMNLKTSSGDQDHAVALFKRDGLWGAISKTNHAVLQYRDPIYRSLRELALSYFPEYFLTETGRKTLRAYSRPLNLNRFGTIWIDGEHDVWKVAYALADAAHTPIAPPEALKNARRATPFARLVLDQEEWNRRGARD